MIGRHIAAPLVVITVVAAAAQTPAAADDDLMAAGREAFAPCRSCHALDVQSAGLPGPNVAGLVGRPVAAVPGFAYSPVLRAAGTEGLVWDLSRLDRFLADPEGMFPGMWMSYPAIGDSEEREALAAFIAAHD